VALAFDPGHIGGVRSLVLALAVIGLTGTGCSPGGTLGRTPPAVGYAAMGATVAAAAATTAAQLVRPKLPEGPPKPRPPKPPEQTVSSPVDEFVACPEGTGTGRYRVRCLTRGAKEWCYYETDDGDGLDCPTPDCKGPPSDALLRWCAARK
jgi:hypothetical protein